MRSFWEEKVPRPLNFKLILVLHNFNSKTSESRHMRNFPFHQNINWRRMTWWKRWANILILQWEVLAEGNFAFCRENSLQTRKNPKCTVWLGILTIMMMLLREEQRKLHTLPRIFSTMSIKRFDSKRCFVGFVSMFFHTQSRTDDQSAHSTYLNVLYSIFGLLVEEGYSKSVLFDLKFFPRFSLVATWGVVFLKAINTMISSET